MSPAMGPRTATRPCTGCSEDLPLLQFAADAASKDGFSDRCNRCRSGLPPRPRPVLRVMQPQPEACRDPHISDAIAEVRKIRGQLSDDRAAIIDRRAGRGGRSPQSVSEEIARLQSRVEDLDMVLRVLEILRRAIGAH